MGDEAATDAAVHSSITVPKERRRVARWLWLRCRPWLAPAGSALPEHVHRLHQPLRLLLQARRRRGALLHQGRVLLGDLVEVGDRIADLAHAFALLLGGVADV